jgi:hypothetical protein
LRRHPIVGPAISGYGIGQGTGVDPPLALNAPSLRLIAGMSLMTDVDADREVLKRVEAQGHRIADHFVAGGDGHRKRAGEGHRAARAGYESGRGAGAQTDLDVIERHRG